MKQRIISSKNFQTDLAIAIAECEHDKTFILVDEHTQELCLPLIKSFHGLKKADVITLKASDCIKTLTLFHMFGLLYKRMELLVIRC